MLDTADRVEVISLGSGTSHGIPMIGCECAVCRSTDPRDKRTRPSIYVCFGNLRLLIDTAPELRLQCVASEIKAIDAQREGTCARHVSARGSLRWGQYRLCSAIFTFPRVFSGITPLTVTSYDYTVPHADCDPISFPD